MIGAYYKMRNVPESPLLQCVGYHANGLHLVLMGDKNTTFRQQDGARMSLSVYNSMREKLPRKYTTNRPWRIQHPDDAVLAGCELSHDVIALLEPELAALQVEAGSVKARSTELRPVSVEGYAG